MTGRRGFSLLEMAVATLLIGLAATALLGTVGDSLAAVQSARDFERASELARNSLDELLAAGQLPIGEEIGGTEGERFGWRAKAEIADRFGKDTAGRALARIRLEVWWISGGQRRAASFETLARTGSP